MLYQAQVISSIALVQPGIDGKPVACGADEVDGHGRFGGSDRVELALSLPLGIAGKFRTRLR